MAVILLDNETVMAGSGCEPTWRDRFRSGAGKVGGLCWQKFPQALECVLSVSRRRKLSRYLAYIDKCDREVAKAEVLIKGLCGAKRDALASDIAELASMKRELARRRRMCERFGAVLLN